MSPVISKDKWRKGSQVLLDFIMHEIQITHRNTLENF
uniref:Uncharacterized protein n=1 Tax=Rhizophora mucronata TaxID=61149 RepID=A0A2P2JSL6_RHIMU